MSYIDSSRKSLNSYYQSTVCLTKEDVVVLIPFFQKIQKQKQTKYEFYKDIHESGEASESQATKMVEYEEQLSIIDCLIDNCNKLLNKK